MSKTLDNECRQMLKQAHLYRTEARVAILKVLSEATGPLRQGQVAEQLLDKGRNKVTIYRTLESLVGAGLVHRAFLHQRAWYFELAHHCTNEQCHPHFSCTQCGKTYCLKELSLPMAPRHHKGFVIQHQQVRLEGLCPACAGSKTT